MPMGDQDTDWMRPTRTFLYGKDKTKKTWWASRAAEDGYNVILIDGDDGASIIKQLPVEARKRILVIDAVNIPGQNTFARFMGTLMRGEPFIWDEQKKVSLRPNMPLQDATHSHVYFDIKKLTMNDVVVVDSWTALANSLMLEWAKECEVDLTAVEKEGDNFAMMGYQSRFLDFCLSKMKTFPCHFIVIGHETVYEKFEDKMEGNKKKRVMVDQQTQPFSSTGPHAKKIGASFSNVLRFRKYSDVSFKIDAGGDHNVMGGCRQLAPKVYDWKDISPQTIFGAVGSKPTGAPCAGYKYLPPGQNLAATSVVPNQPAAQNVPAQAQVVDAGVVKSGLSLLKKKA